MATQTTQNVYIPKDLIAPLARYLVEHHQKAGKVIQDALREKLEREGYVVIKS
jgi:hypothetical protein